MPRRYVCFSVLAPVRVLFAVSLVLAGCTGDRSIQSGSVNGAAGAVALYPAEDTGRYKYDAWRPLNTATQTADMLREVDRLIALHDWRAAATKLEAVIVRQPDNAEAWSRMAWLALQMNTPARSVKMASHSNSLSYANPALQSLNWSFIKTASKQLNDEETYFKASQKIKSLRKF